MSIINVNEIRVGNIIKHENRICKVSKAEHVKPGKGGAYMQLEMKDVRTGTKLNARIRTEEKVEKPTCETKLSNVLIKDSESITLMNPETYDQETYNIEDYCGEQGCFFEEGMEVKLHYIDDQLISITPPDNVVLEILETQPYIKGAAVTSSFKAAFCRDGIKIMVPQYMEYGAKILVKTENFEFIEKVK